MRILTLTILFLASFAALAQSNQVTLSAVGNFNQPNFIGIYNNQTKMTGSNKSSLGYSIEYQRWLSTHNSVGITWEQNPSDGKLYSGGIWYIWPLMRYENYISFMQQANVGKFAPFIREGAGLIITNGYSNSGWSENFAFVSGFGVDYPISGDWYARGQMTLLNDRPGCYGDPYSGYHNCQPTWGMSQDVSIGISRTF